MNKHLGQHFLKNKQAVNKIIAVLDIQPFDQAQGKPFGKVYSEQRQTAQGKQNETIIEIGPGHGELTGELKSKNYELKIIAIEKDEKLAQFLQQKFVSDKNIKIIRGDALKILTDLTNDQRLTTNNYKIVGNIPYYITGKLLRIISELKNKPVLTVLMIQKEVAERICTKTMNLLAAAVQFWAEPKIIFKLKPSDFSPAPKVDSAVIQLTTLRQSSGQANDKQLTTQKEKDEYYKLIRVIFKQPRKTLINNLKELNTIQPTTYNKRLTTQKQKDEYQLTTRKEKKKYLKSIIKSLNLPLNCRPQDLAISDIVKLTQIIPVNPNIKA